LLLFYIWIWTFTGGKLCSIDAECRGTAACVNGFCENKGLEELIETPTPSPRLDSNDVMYCDKSGALPSFEQRHGGGCEHTCILSCKDPEVLLFDSRRPVVTDVPSIGVLLTESLSRYPFRTPQALLGQISYRPDSLVPFYGMMYDTSKDLENAMTLPLVSRTHKIQHSLMSVWISSNNDKYPVLVWKDLEKYGITIASYGRFQRDHQLTDEVDQLNWVREWDNSGPMDGK